MDINQESLALKAMELAYGGLHYSDIFMEQTLSLSIGYLYEMYQVTGKKEYLHNALLHIWAFIRLGFEYRRCDEMVDKILDGLGMEKERFFKETALYRKKVKLTRPQIRGMIGKWMPSANAPKKIGEVVDEIIEKVKNQEQGIYTYSYKRGNTEDIYELVISPDQCFFHDLRRQKFYFFDLPEK